MMKTFQKYQTFTDGIKNNAHLTSFSQKEFEDYFFFYMKKNLSDTNFYLKYIETFYSGMIKELLKKHPLKVLFNDLETQDVKILIKNKIYINYKEKEYEFDKILDFKLCENKKSIMKMLLHKNLYETIRLIFINYLK